MLEKGDQSNIDAPRQVLVRTKAEYAVLWRQHAGDRPQPPVDFSKEMVVGVFMGSAPTAGYSIAVISAIEANGALIVCYKPTAPGRGLMTAQVLTFPYHIVAIPKAAVTDVKFEKVDP